MKKEEDEKGLILAGRKSKINLDLLYFIHVSGKSMDWTSNAHPCVAGNPTCRNDIMVWGSQISTT
jgi:hypothetical protein